MNDDRSALLCASGQRVNATDRHVPKEPRAEWPQHFAAGAESVAVDKHCVINTSIRARVSDRFMHDTLSCSGGVPVGHLLYAASSVSTLGPGPAGAQRNLHSASPSRCVRLVTCSSADQKSPQTTCTLTRYMKDRAASVNVPPMSAARASTTTKHHAAMIWSTSDGAIMAAATEGRRLRRGPEPCLGAGLWRAGCRALAHAAQHTQRRGTGGGGAGLAGGGGGRGDSGTASSRARSRVGNPGRGWHRP